jgi:hypothetical protein
MLLNEWGDETREEDAKVFLERPEKRKLRNKNCQSFLSLAPSWQKTVFYE